jgi:hypothetical protein
MHRAQQVSVFGELIMMNRLTFVLLLVLALCISCILFDVGSWRIASS